jgi:DNA-binding transcriptional regulator LsrR (DeoR family)
MNEKGTNIETAPSQNDNYNFVQLSKGYLQSMRKLSRKNPLASEILLYFVEHMGRTTNAVVCSYKVLCEVTGVSRPTVARAIKVLKEDNWVDAVKIGNATAYCVNERAFWQAGRLERKFAIFSATVIASESEQDSDYHNKAKHRMTHVPVIRDNDITSVMNENLPPPDQHELDV